MSFERELWFGQFSRSRIPRYRCPNCDVERLVSGKESLSVIEAEYSKKGHLDENWEPDWVVERFSLRLSCDHPECGEHSFMIGDTTIQERMTSNLAGD
ncbi:hypothetical protein D8I24_3219 [Cupriavidus necator H850]|uniref:hypothetical protein n=1 Tax=Cupriavidus necator TaxID=106590 RepID=UPI001892BE58|nr:hypothetical protein [Cupriavidus necator]KAI3602820.1 hypothetical protein D8I24_3219 [Cupriavidus necator H850]